MQKLTAEGQQIMADLAQRYGVSTDAVMTMLQALVNGNGTMAQFNHPEFGGSGQWMQGGMTMVGDMFNYGLKSKVDGLCTELSNLLASQPFVVRPASSQSQSQGAQQQQQGGYGLATGTGGDAVSLFVPAPAGTSGDWWPANLGVPNATGAQNNIRYAYFAATRRLAIEINGHITVYDTLDHQIGGVSQQQSTDASLTFTSQFGLVRLSTLPVVSIDGVAPDQTKPAVQKAREKPEHEQAGEDISTATPQSIQESDIFSKIERLAELRQKDILTEEEFAAKKAELLSKL